MTSRQKRKLTEFLFLVPTLIAFLMVIIIPFIFGIYYSFTDWQGTGVVNKVVGLENYRAIFQEPGFLHSFLVTLLFTVLNIITVNVVAFIISLLVTSEIRGRNVYRAGFFVPNLIGGIVLGLVWQFIFSNILPTIGQTLGWATLSKSLISNKDTAMITLVTVNTWQYAGYIMLIYINGLATVPKDVLEAAQIDGASEVKTLFAIKIPMIAATFTICTFLTLTSAFKQFDVNLALTNGVGTVRGFMGTRLSNGTQMIALNIYNTAFARDMYGYAQAKAILFFIILATVSLIQVRISNKREVEM